MRPDGASGESKSSVSPPPAANQSKGNSKANGSERLGSYLSARPGHCRLIYLFAEHKCELHHCVSPGVEINSPNVHMECTTPDERSV
jgi:hypothetical protein